MWTIGDTGVGKLAVSSFITNTLSRSADRQRSQILLCGAAPITLWPLSRTMAVSSWQVCRREHPRRRGAFDAKALPACPTTEYVLALSCFYHLASKSGAKKQPWHSVGCGPIARQLTVKTRARRIWSVAVESPSSAPETLLVSASALR